MNKIVLKKCLNPTVTLMEIQAPLIANKAKAGQFIILRVNENGERIPLTIADSDIGKGTITIIFQVVGRTTTLLNMLQEGDALCDLVGPLGKATEIDGIKRACVIGGGVGSAIAYPIAKALKNNGAYVHSIIGFRSHDLVILENNFAECSSKLDIATDDGSYIQKGFVTDILRKTLSNGEKYDEIFAIGPLPMMRSVVETARPFGTKVTVSMNPIMIDGTGMCGGCRLTVGGKTKFACIDGPDFDGYEVDFDSAINRNRAYHEYEKEACNLLKKGDK